MKKNCLLSLLLLAIYSLSFAKEVPVTTAKTVGFHYLLQHGATSLNNENELKLVYTSGSPALFYVFSGSSSFVMVSADDAVTPVLGYSKENVFDATHLPSSVTSFLDNYNVQITYAIINKAEATAELAAQWNDLALNTSSGTAAKTTAVLPLLSTTWDQAPYYNAYCPADAAAPSWMGNRVPTGCVATAMAQVMKFWSWPATGSGVHSYSTPSYGTLTANFAGSTYNWSSMPNNITSSNPSISRLMSDVGISIDMQYGPNESGAYVIASMSPIVNCAEYALKTYFDYASSLQGLQRGSYTDVTWINMIESDLNAGRPVIYAGSGTGGGHCFVVDGFDASDNFHINWGWSGADNGYFYMNALNPSSLGTGGGAGGFNDYQHAILGLRPNSAVSAAFLELSDYVTLSTPGIQYGDTFSVVTNLLNSGTGTFNGSIALAAFDATSGAFVTFLDSATGVSLPASSAFGAPGLTANGMWSLAMLPGNYNIGIMYRNVGGTWITVANGGSGAYVNAAPITVYNHNFIQLYSNMTPTPNPMVQGSAATVNLTAFNSDAAAWADSMYLGLYNFDGSWNSNIAWKGVTSIGSMASSGPLSFTTSNVTAAPGTYLMILFFKYAGTWYICGSDYNQNPIYATVVAPPPPPDIYEVNNTSGTAYNLSSTLTWSANVSSTSTPGSTIHISTDHDYYKVVLPAGYNYSISARVNDVVNKDDAGNYTADVLWSYSTNGGTSWSTTYNNTMTGTINLTGLTGGTVIFHVSPAFAGSIGSYLLKVGNITRSVANGIPDPALSSVRIFPNPATDAITVDMGTENISARGVTLTDIQGKKVYAAEVTGQSPITIPVQTLPAGVYFITVVTDAGTINKKITVAK